MLKKKTSPKRVAAKVAKIVAGKVAGAIVAKAVGGASDAASKARRIAERAKPNMQVVEVIPESDAVRAAPDATTPEIERTRRKYGFKPVAPAKKGKQLHMVIMKPKKATDSRAGEQRRIVIVDDEKVVGEQG